MDNTLPPGSPLLPIPRTRLIGRDTERAAALALLFDEATPLLTLTGPGGVGKTRLALAIASDVAPHFDDGTLFVDLARLDDPGLVVPSVARTLGIAEGGDQPLSERLVVALQRRHLLLIFDNCEHLLSAVAELVAPLLSGCPKLQVLATSRAPLRIRGEQELPVEPLPLPPLDARQALALSENPAMQLFIERARAVDPRFSTRNDSLHDVAAICRELDGLPLAIELAAARVRVLAPSALRDRLQHRLPVLEGGSRDAPARQRTMRDTIAWSYSLLTPDEQHVFRRLAVFSGGFTLEAAQAVTRQGSTADVLPQLERLAEHSLIRRDEQLASQRYQLLETIREFAREQLAVSGEEGEARRAHGAYFLAFAEHAAARLYRAKQLDWLTQLETDHPNLRAALEWCRDQNDPDGVLRLVAALWRFWFIRGHSREGRTWLSQALVGSHPWSPLLREALDGSSMLASNQGDHRDAAAIADQLLLLAREHQDDEGIARALFLQSFAATYLGDRERARRLATDAVVMFRDLGDPHRLGNALNRLGIEEHNQGNYTRAAALYEEALGIWRDLGCTWELVCVTTNLGVTAQAQGDMARAAAQYREGLVLLQTVGETWMVEELLALVAALAAETGANEQAARLIGTTDRRLELIGFALAPFVQVFYERARTHVRRELGEDAFAVAREVGERLTTAEAVSEAFDVASTVATTFTIEGAGLSIRSHFGLTPRELEVLRLVAVGRSNAEISSALFISVPTVKRHLTTILGKLSLPSRSAATAYAHTHGLV